MFASGRGGGGRGKKKVSVVDVRNVRTLCASLRLQIVGEKQIKHLLRQRESSE